MPVSSINCVHVVHLPSQVTQLQSNSNGRNFVHGVGVVGVRRMLAGAL